MEEIKISVRNLVEFILRSGDIDTRKGTTKDKEAMQLGSKLHRKIQGRKGSDYIAEVSLKHRIECERYVILLEGRADGIQTRGNKVLVDEIKGTFRELAGLNTAAEVHQAQAKCYAYIYSKQKDLKNIAVQVTYCHMDTEEIKQFVSEYSFAELETWFVELIGCYQKWCEFQTAWKARRQESISRLEFPFAYREGQRDLVASVYRTIYHKKKLFIQAPTGVGKTISTIFPAVKAVGENLGDKLFYLTAKTITRTVAEETFAMLKAQGLDYKIVTLTAKEKLCQCEEMSCNPQDCPYAKGHFDRINNAVFEMLEKGDEFSRESLLEQSEKWQVCPYELSLDVAVWVDAVICDYNYVFDPRVHLKQFFSEGIKGNYLFLIDEAHNLVERGREMFSATLVKEDIMAVKRAVKPYNKKLEQLLEKCNKQMLEWKRECESYEIHENLGNFPITLMNLQAEMEKFLEEVEQTELREQVLELYFAVLRFLDTYDLIDEHYVIYTEMLGNGVFIVKLFCVDPSKNIQNSLDKGNSTIFFSATLLPIRYYMRMLSTEPDDYAVYANSPFETKQKQVLIGEEVSSRYIRRGPKEYAKIAEYLSIVTSHKKGNYIAFFPSYKMMEEVADIFDGDKENNSVSIRQSSYMSEQEREAFLETFAADNKTGLLGFCVMGGVFGEGIDLKNDRLIGAIIIGTGIPQINNEREILKNYYDEKEDSGYAYAYLYPGMNKVLQAAGRVIRTDTDKGIILLLDERFKGREYLEMFPTEWLDYEVCQRQNITKYLTDFWTD